MVSSGTNVSSTIRLRVTPLAKIDWPASASNAALDCPQTTSKIHRENWYRTQYIPMRKNNMV